ncbi:MAG: hypothetical protein EBQ85_03940 [Proteobacteria bacterium]|nr:hypothetical protein [Pseudomonadota bacterium]
MALSTVHKTTHRAVSGALGALLNLAVSVALLGCASQPVNEPFHTRLYVGTYDDVWLACLKSLNDYPLKVSNKDSGKIQTETVNGPYNELVLTYPAPLELPEKFRYSLRFNFAKLVSEKTNKPLVRIRVIKELEQFQDFYTGWTSYPSDGLEEKVLLYRVQQVLNMERAISQSEQQRRKNP